jgi:hypothetical protein
VISLRALDRYSKPRHEAPGDRCGLCAAEVGEGHRHVVDVERRALLCACRACAILFVPSGASEGRFRTVPDRVLWDEGFRLSEAAWTSLEIPVRLAFLFFSSAARRWIALYPSPAGATESALPLDAWETFARAPLIQSVEPDVEALFVYGRRGATEFEMFLTPIDVCYELVGRVRRLWRGMGGGSDVWREIDDSFARLRARGRPMRARNESEQAAP